MYWSGTDFDLDHKFLTRHAKFENSLVYQIVCSRKIIQQRSSRNHESSGEGITETTSTSVNHMGLRERKVMVQVGWHIGQE